MHRNSLVPLTGVALLVIKLTCRPFGPQNRSDRKRRGSRWSLRVTILVPLTRPGRKSRVGWSQFPIGSIPRGNVEGNRTRLWISVEKSGCLATSLCVIAYIGRFGDGMLTGASGGRVGQRTTASRTDHPGKMNLGNAGTDYVLGRSSCCSWKVCEI